MNVAVLRGNPAEMHHPPLVVQLLNEMSRLQSTVLEHQEHHQRLQQEMGGRLREREQTIKAQREQVTAISHSSAIIAGEEAKRRGSPCSGFPVFATWAEIVSYWDVMTLYIWHRARETNTILGVDPSDGLTCSFV